MNCFSFLRSHRCHAVLLLLCAAAGLSASAAAVAGVVIGSTRVIYPARQKEVTVRLENKNPRPSLVQVWLDDGDADVAPEQADVPFNVLPPLFRMEAGKQHVLRIAKVGAALPGDRESLFWLNALEVPPKPGESADGNQLQIAFRTRIKLLYRPHGLEYPVEAALQKLQWQLLQDGQGRALQVHNPTPYHVSFDAVAVMVDGLAQPMPDNPDPEASMVRPQASTRWPLSAAAGSARQVVFTAIDDYGARIPMTVPLLP